MQIKKSFVPIALGIVLLLFGAAHSKFIWWKAASKVGPDPLLSISVGDSLHIWASGIPQLVTHTTDGGVTWSLRPPPPNSYSVDFIDFIDSLRGWGAGPAGGSDGSILRTTDGGQSWAVQVSLTGMSMRGIEFMDSFYGVAIGGGEPGLYALFTSNGGLNWRQSFYPLSTVSIHALKVLDTNHVWVGGNNFFDPNGDTSVAFFSSDWGRTWQAQAPHEQFSLWYVIAIDFLDTINGYLLAQYGNGAEHHLYRTSDGGASWSRILELSAFSNWVLNDMDAVDTLDIWMAGHLFQGDNIAGFLHSSDVGAAWDTILTETYGSFQDLEMHSSHQGWAVGWEGLLYVYLEIILGDLNLDKEVTTADVVLELMKVFSDQAFPAPPETGDVNCDGTFTPSDVVLILIRTFLEEPFPCSI